MFKLTWAIGVTVQHKVDPRQNQLFDPFALVFSKAAYRHVKRGWYGVFRHVLLELMPVDVLEQKYDPSIGRPTKELYSMAGLVFIMEFNDWTEPQGVHAYMFDAAVQYALNLEPAKQSLSEATLQRYRRHFREDDTAARLFDEVTQRLVGCLDLTVRRQRLDSSHVLSNMANFGRTRLLAITIKRFLTQLKRHDQSSYRLLPKRFSKRYDKPKGSLLPNTGTKKRRRFRQECAEDLLFLIERFADDEDHNGRQTYKMLLRVFEDQCRIVGDEVEVRARPGGDIVVNSSDPDATWDGHKGAGYKMHASETCSKDNEVQLIVAAEVETAVNSDQAAVGPILEDLENKDMLPELMLADGGYGGDRNFCLAEERGVDLQSPVCGARPADAYRLNVDDFVIDPDSNQVVRCPAGHEPLLSKPVGTKGNITALMPQSACGPCPFRTECPIGRRNGKYRILIKPEKRRLAARRREQQTQAFQDLYAQRAGAEGTFSGVKRSTGAARLRVRRLPAVRHALFSKLIGWNIRRAAASNKMQALVAAAMAPLKTAILAGKTGLKTAMTAMRALITLRLIIASQLAMPVQRNLRWLHRRQIGRAPDRLCGLRVAV